MSALDNLLNDLVIANKILAKEEVVDAYGHISVRHPDNPKHFFLSRSLVWHTLSIRNPHRLSH